MTALPYQKISSIETDPKCVRQGIRFWVGCAPPVNGRYIQRDFGQEFTVALSNNYYYVKSGNIPRSTNRGTRSIFLVSILFSEYTFCVIVLIVQLKSSKNVNFMTKLKKHASVVTLKSLCYSLIFPYLSFDRTLWGSNNYNALSKVIILQNRAIHIINDILPLLKPITPYSITSLLIS